MKQARKKDLIDQLKADIAKRNAIEDKKLESPIHPSLSLLCKLGSIAVHAEEMLSPTGHRFDIESLKACFDSEVRQWIKAMGAFMPVKR